MTRTSLLALFLIALSVESSGAEIFECVETDGGIRFVDDPHACSQAKLHPLKARVERLPAAIPSSSDVSPEPAGLRLEQLLLASSDVSADWSVVGETPIDPISDTDLLSWGVRAQRSRHYTRSSSGAVQVCSIELWAFEDTPHARIAHENFAYPNWQIEREGPVLVMVRALTRRDGSREDRALFSACVELGERVRVRAARNASD
jgi:hypothetical protein